MPQQFIVRRQRSGLEHDDDGGGRVSKADALPIALNGRTMPGTSVIVNMSVGRSSDSGGRGRASQLPLSLISQVRTKGQSIQCVHTVCTVAVKDVELTGHKVRVQGQDRLLLDCVN